MILAVLAMLPFWYYVLSNVVRDTPLNQPKAKVVRHPVKAIVVTADFRPGTETIPEHYGRIVDAVLEGRIKPATDSWLECYCDKCKKVFAGNWVDHQKQVHGRSPMQIEKETQS